MTRLPALLLAATLATGCASVPMAPPEADAAAKQFRTTPGLSNLYVFRDESMGAAVKMSVVLDGRLLGDTASKTYLLATLQPGRHSLLSKTENDATLDLVAEPGKNLFVWQEVKMGLLGARSALHLLDDASARERIAACSLAVSEPPPAPAPAPAAGVPRS